MSDRILLMFAYHFPPENVIGAARPYRFYKYLSRRGYRCHVITAAAQADGSELDAEYVADPFVTKVKAGAGWQVERAVRKLFLPGVTGTQWFRHAARAGSEFIRKQRHTRITLFSTYPPMGTHAAAWQLAKDTGLPWVADFRDPIADNPGAGKVNGFQKKLFQRLERMVMEQADLIIANTDAVQELWQRQYPQRRGRVHLIWNGFDPEDRIEPLGVPARPYRVVRHVGELYEGRTCTALLESAARLIERGRLSPARVRFELIGPARFDSIPGPAFLARAKELGWLEMAPEVPRAEARRMIQTCDGLLLVQPQSRVQVPGKLFEYLQIGRPILAYIPRDSAIVGVLRQSGVLYGCAFADMSAEEMDAAVGSYFDLPFDAARPSTWFEESFNAERQTAELYRLIEALGAENCGTVKRK